MSLYTTYTHLAWWLKGWGKKVGWRPVTGSGWSGKISYVQISRIGTESQIPFSKEWTVMNERQEKVTHLPNGPKLHTDHKGRVLIFACTPPSTQGPMQAGAIAPASGFSVIERAPGRRHQFLFRLKIPLSSLLFSWCILSWVELKCFLSYQRKRWAFASTNSDFLPEFPSCGSWGWPWRSP